MTKVLLGQSPIHNDPTSFYRARGPFGALKMEGWVQNWPEKVSDADLLGIDVLFMHRPFRQDHLETIQRAKALGKPVWVDFDDNLLHLDRCNPAYDIYAPQATQKMVIGILNIADIVTVTTEQIQKDFAPFRKEKEAPRILPNAWPDKYFPLKKKPYFKDHQRVFWRGSRSHFTDIFEHKEELAKIAKKYPHLEWVVAGNPTQYLIDVVPEGKLKAVPTLDVLNYFCFLKVLEASIAICPLADTKFSRSRSNIFWQEATAGGCPIVAPDFEEWRMDGIVNYGKSADGYSRSMTLSEAFDECWENAEKYYDKSWDSMIEYRLLSRVNKQREAILRELT